jgi:MFS family permease
VPMYMLTCKLYTPMLAGVAMLPFCLTVVPVSGIAGSLISRLGSYRWVLWIGWPLNTVGLATLSLLQPETPPVVWIFVLICAGAGQGLLLMGNSTLVQASAEDDEAAHAVGMYSFLRSFGFVLGVVTSAAIFQNFMQQKTVDAGILIDSGAGIEGLTTIIRSMGRTKARLQVQKAFAWALQRLWIIKGSLSGCAGLLSIAGLRHKSLDR